MRKNVFFFSLFVFFLVHVSGKSTGNDAKDKTKNGSVNTVTGGKDYK